MRDDAYMQNTSFGMKLERDESGGGTNIIGGTWDPHHHTPPLVEQCNATDCAFQK